MRGKLLVAGWVGLTASVWLAIGSDVIRAAAQSPPALASPPAAAAPADPVSLQIGEVQGRIDRYEANLKGFAAAETALRGLIASDEAELAKLAESHQVAPAAAAAKVPVAPVQSAPRMPYPPAAVKR